MALEQKLRDFLNENPDDAMTLLSLGSIFLREKRIEEALSALERAIAVDPDYMAAYPALGECRERLGDVNGARDAYSRALELADALGDGAMANDMTAKLQELAADI